MKRLVRRIERKFWGTAIIYASIPVFVVVIFNMLASIWAWLLALDGLLIGGYLTFRLYRRYLLRR